MGMTFVYDPFQVGKKNQTAVDSAAHFGWELGLAMLFLNILN